MTKKSKRARGYCPQRHHIEYNPEKTVLLYRQEHFWLTRMGWAKKTSRGFLTALRDFIKKKKGSAVRIKKK